ncbi:MAG: YceI family protein [Thermoanaerobaculia bacterium]
MKLLASLLLAACLAAPASAQSVGSQTTDPAVALAPPPRVLKYRFVPEKSKISFELPTTFHLVHGTIESWNGTAETDPERPGVLRSRITFRAESLHTGSARRDAVMHDKVLESSQFPEIVFEGKSYKGDLSAFGPGATVTVDVAGNVLIHGVSKPLQASIQCAVLGDHILVAGAVPIHWKQYGLRNMSTFFNRISDPLTVIFRLWAVPEN